MFSTLQQLLHHGGQKCLLRLDAAQIAVLVAVGSVPEPQYLHGVVPREQAVARFLVDIEVLQGVTVIHVPGHIEPDAAHSVHDLAHGLPLHNHLIVRLKAHQLGRSPCRDTGCPGLHRRTQL